MNPPEQLPAPSEGEDDVALHQASTAHHGGADGDAGYTMFEVVIAMAIFTVLAGSVFTLLTGTMRTVGDNGHRSVAADLASSQIEQARGMRALDIADGLTTRTQAVGGTTYTISQTANYVASDSTTPVCVGTGDTLTYKRVDVQVTWPSMGTTKPVAAQTLRSLGLGADGLASGTGALAVVVQGANANPVSGALVTLSPGGTTRTTGSDGCAVFTGLAPASYTASIDQSGRIASTGYQAVSTPATTVTAGRVQRASLYVDVARTRSFTLAPPAGYAVPAGLSLLFRDTYVTDTVAVACGSGPVRTCATAVPGELRNLFPDSYALWVGTCSDADDSGTATFDVSGAAASTTSTAVPMGGVQASARSILGQSRSAALYAVHTADSASGTGSQCASGETYALGTAGSSPVRTALPFGTWTITANPSAPSIFDPRVTLTSSSGTQSATVTVS